jgi:cytochrome P450
MIFISTWNLFIHQLLSSLSLRDLLSNMMASIGSLSRLDASHRHAIASAVALISVGAIVCASLRARSKIPRDEDGKPLPRPPTTLPLIGNTLDFFNNRARMHDWICETTRIFGGRPWVLQALGQPKMIILTSPQAFEDVERKLFDKFGKGPYLYDFLHDFLGDGILSVDRDMWAYQRKTTVALFSSRALRDSMVAIIHKHSVTLDSIFEKAAATQTEVNVSKLLHQFTMESFTEIGFGLELGCLGLDDIHPFESAFDDAQHVIMTRMQLPTFVWKLQRLLGVGLEGHLKKCISIVNETVISIIHQTMANAQKPGNAAEGSNEKDLVTLFLASENFKGKLTAVMLRDIVLTLLLGGRGTTAEALSWLFYSLSQHPAVEQKIRDEIALKMGTNTDANERVDIDALQQLTYLEAALKETVRLYPPGSFNLRYCYEDATLSDGTFIPAGCYATICPFTTARRTDVWGDDAAEFKPERWLDPSNPDRLLTVSSYKFNSFLGGPRVCIGMKLAMMEMKTVAVKTLRKFQFELSPGQSITYRHSLTLPIKDGLRVRIKHI